MVTDFRDELLADRYRVTSLQGTGSQDSTVWLARQLSVDRDVAVKLMPIRKDVARQRFARGARLASMLNHPHITTVHDYGESGDSYVYMVMELLTGRTLREEVQGGQGLSLERSLHITCQVLRALEEAHSHQIVHRDLKPDNLFLTPRLGDHDFVKVLDFGIAKLFERPAQTEEDTGTTMDGQVTRGWQLCGTPLYMAPEQISGEPVDGRTDIYALGVVLYQMLTGRVPFRAKTQYAVLSQHLRDPPPAMGEVNPGVQIPAEIEAIAARAMSKDAADRFPSAKDMRRAIQGAQAALGLRIDSTADTDDDLPRRSPTVDEPRDGGLQFPEPPLPPPAPRRNRAGIAVAATLVLALGAWGLGKATMNTDARGGEESTAPDPPREQTVRPSLEPLFEPTPDPGSEPREQPSIQAEDTRNPPISLDLRTTPSGAVVKYEGEPMGRTPITVSLRSDRSHRLDLALDGYESHTVLVDPQQLEGSGSAVEHHVTLDKVRGTGVPSRRSSRPESRRSTRTSPPRSEKVDNEPILKLPGGPPRIDVLE